MIANFLPPSVFSLLPSAVVILSALSLQPSMPLQRKNTNPNPSTNNIQYHIKHSCIPPWDIHLMKLIENAEYYRYEKR